MPLSLFPMPALNVVNHCQSQPLRRNFIIRSFGHAVVRSAVQFSTGSRLSHAAPLLEKEGNTGFFALVADVRNPICLHRSGAVAAFASDNDPMDPQEIHWPEVFQ